MLSQWQHILRPIDCGPMRLKNRLTSAPINTGLENLSNLAALADFYAESAADGVSLVTLFSPALSGQAKQNADILPTVSDDFRRYKPILKAVSSFDCRVAIELNHIGQDAGVLFPISSVPGVSKHTGKSFHAAPAFLIRKAIHQFAQCAQRAASVGFDAVEINASGRSLIASFLSPAINTRQDAWGTNQLGRFRFFWKQFAAASEICLKTKRSAFASISWNSPQKVQHGTRSFASFRCYASPAPTTLSASSTDSKNESRRIRTPFLKASGCRPMKHLRKLPICLSFYGSRLGFRPVGRSRSKARQRGLFAEYASAG